MSGDFTRHTFRKNKHYSGVLLQQGRVQVDADFNEQVDITHHCKRVTTADIVGVTGMPEDAPGFSVTAVDNDLLLGPGRAYVNGILVEYEVEPTTLEVSDNNGINTVWKVIDGQRLLASQWLAEDDPSTRPAFRVSEILEDSEDDKQRLKVSQDLGTGTAVVFGLASTGIQPDMPASALPDVAGSYLVYLDVWELEITAIEDPDIKEIALGGVDTAIRTRVVWQVKLLDLKPGIDAGEISDPPVCAEFAAGWSPAGDTEPARLAAQTDPSDETKGPCVLPSKGGYRDLENHLYRVQVHGGGSIGQDKVFIKWSRDNAIHRSRLHGIKDGNLLIGSVGKDDVTSFKPDDWLEVQDEARIQAGEPGFFVRIGGVVENSLEVKEVLYPVTLDPHTDNGEPDTSVLPRIGVVRRWEGGKPVEVNPGAWIPLEKGVEVQLTEGLSTNNDHWLIPARTLTADIEWPVNPADGSPAFERPIGIRHHYAALALATFDDAGIPHNPAGVWDITDCRNIFPPLTRLSALFYVSGDGQEATPDPVHPGTRVPLGEPLKVGVARGSTPIEGARVRYEVTKGDGRLTGDVTELVVDTNPLGIAPVDWFLDGTTLDQHITAELINSADESRHIPVIFTGRLSRASEVAYGPPGCPDLAGKKTVQQAIDALCTMRHGGCATYVVGPNDDWADLLQNLNSRENAHICFQRGAYKVRGPVVMKGYGHITLSGIGAGTEIFALSTETAFHFIGCKSVTVESMRISAPDGNDAIKHISGLNGVVTATGCAIVNIRDTAIHCGAGASLERTCITVRASEDTPVVPSESVRILSNRLEVGHWQNGVLVTDANRVMIEDNEIAVRKRPRSLTFDRLIIDKKRRAKLVKMLVKDVVIGESEPVGGKRKVLKAGVYTASFQSSVPESELRALMKGNPPTAEDTRTATKFGGYVEKLINSAVDQPKLLPSYESHLNRIRRDMTTIEFDGLNRAVRKGLVVSSKIEVKKFNQLMDETRSVAMVIDNNRLQFNSPVKQAVWSRIIRTFQPAKVRSDSDLLAAVKGAALRLVTNKQFRDRFSSARAWFEQLKLKNPAVGNQSIVCAGGVLGDVRIRKNSIFGFHEAIHVGVSKEATPKDEPLLVESVDISENRVILRVPLEEAVGQYGVFIGNAHRILVENNQLTNPNILGESPYMEGVRIWGHLGPYVVLRQNSTTFCSTGIRVEVEQQVPPLVKNPLWRAVDNFILDGNIKLPPGKFIERDNVIT